MLWLFQFKHIFDGHVGDQLKWVFYFFFKGTAISSESAKDRVQERKKHILLSLSVKDIDARRVYNTSVTTWNEEPNLKIHEIV